MIYPFGSVIHAPLSGFTDLPYRRAASRCGCQYVFTQMVDAGALASGNVKTLRLLERGDDESWLGVQLIGSDAESLAAAVKVLNRYHFDVLDFNLGCPAPKVVKKGDGAALAKQRDTAVALMGVLVATSDIPVTAKIRIQDQEDPEPTVMLVRGLAEAGAVAVTVHGRVMEQFYSGPVYTEIIRSVRESVNIQIIANGGIMDAACGVELCHRTGCSEIMVARGAMGNPWLFQELQDKDGYQPPMPSEYATFVERHIREMIDYYGYELGFKVSRKVILDYMRGRGFRRELKHQVIKLSSLDDLHEFCAELSAGPSRRYLVWQKNNPEAPRRLKVCNGDA